MSQPLINRSPDLQRLRDEGYEVSIRYGHLVVSHIPYVNRNREIGYGMLISDLSLAGDVTTRPANHIALFAGDYPHDANGQPLEKLRHQTLDQPIGESLTANHSFSSKPPAGYDDYFQKMTVYADMISRHAMALDSSVTPRTFAAVEDEFSESPFVYMDNASGRAGVCAVMRKLELARVGIIGLGGTGSYVLDLIAKTPAREIAIFDGDVLSQHNAFRTPGAVPIEVLRNEPKKVDYLHGIYAAMHKNIVPHPYFVDASNIASIGDFDFVFLSMDAGEAKRAIVAHLEARNTPFVDVGMGIELIDDALLGILRVTTSTPTKRDHVHQKKRISFAENAADALYAKNIQVADLNALNATLAVIKFKKVFEFYVDLDREHFSAYTLDGNIIVNEDRDEA